MTEANADTDGRYRQYTFPSGVGPFGPRVSCCNECGVLVLDQPAHDAWHDQIGPS